MYLKNHKPTEISLNFIIYECNSKTISYVCMPARAKIYYGQYNNNYTYHCPRCLQTLVNKNDIETIRQLYNLGGETIVMDFILDDYKKYELF